jgi:repressor LexA
VTVKQYFREGALIRLQPANPAVPVMRFPEERVTVQGVVIGVLRRYS